eukprot:1161729-Pelagomonas_calceolata.AAC.8
MTVSNNNAFAGHECAEAQGALARVRSCPVLPHHVVHKGEVEGTRAGSTFQGRSLMPTLLWLWAANGNLCQCAGRRALVNMQK